MMDYATDIVKEISEGLNSKLDDILIEGLSLKGYDVDHKFGIEEFIKTRCYAIQSGSMKTFFVDKKPFLEFHENTKVNTNIIDGEYKMNASLGEYRYL